MAALGKVPLFSREAMYKGIDFLFLLLIFTSY
ncbi:hypothetical protein [Methanosarcina sp. UBA411]